MKNWFGKPKAVGISTAELEAVQEQLDAEYANTAAAHKKPTEYMRGLKYAIDALGELAPHEL